MVTARTIAAVTLFLLFQGTSCIAILLSKWNVECDGETLDKMNGCLNQYMMLEGGQWQVPGDLEKADQWCKRANESLDCASGLLAKCLSGKWLEALDSGALEDLCSSPQSLGALLDHSSCLVQFGGDLGHMLFNFSSLLLKSSKTRAALCCNFSLLKQSLASFDFGTCDNNSLAYMSGLGDAFLVKIEHLVCPNITSSRDEACQVTSVEDGQAQVESAIAKANTPEKFLNPFLALLLTLGDEWTTSE